MAEPAPHGRAEASALLARHGLAPRRALGQHFLVDPNLVRKTVDLVGGEPGDPVLEIGAGTGTMTRELVRRGYQVVAYEVDERLAPLLDEALAGLSEVEVRMRDAMDEAFEEVLDAGPWRLAANLPYHIGTPLLLRLVRSVPQIVRFVVMVQREVGERLVAESGDPAYGLPSVVTALHTRRRIAFRVPPQVFLPPPNVDSVVVVLDRRRPDRAAERAIEIAAAGFGQRRKMVRRSLAKVLTVSDIVAAGVDPTVRAEQLEPGDFLRLAESTRAG